MDHPMFLDRGRGFQIFVLTWAINFAAIKYGPHPEPLLLRSVRTLVAYLFVPFEIAALSVTYRSLMASAPPEPPSIDAVKATP